MGASRFRPSTPPTAGAPKREPGGLWVATTPAQSPTVTPTTRWIVSRRTPSQRQPAAPPSPSCPPSIWPLRTALSNGNRRGFEGKQHGALDRRRAMDRGHDRPGWDSAVRALPRRLVLPAISCGTDVHDRGHCSRIDALDPRWPLTQPCTWTLVGWTLLRRIRFKGVLTRFQCIYSAGGALSHPHAPRP